jgi:hypothetical protein
VLLEIAIATVTYWVTKTVFTDDGDAREAAGFCKGIRHAKAKHILKWRKIIRRVEEIKSTLDDDRQYFDLLVALYAVAISAAYADGRFTKAEDTSIREFIAGISHVALPKPIKASFERICKAPPSLSTVMRFVRKVPQQYWPLFTDVIDFVLNADGRVTEKERAFQLAWREKAAA